MLLQICVSMAFSGADLCCDPEMASAESLLDERIPIGAIVTRKRIKASRPKLKPEWRGSKYQTEKAPGLPAAEIISGSALHLLALSDGTSMLSLGRTALTAEIGDDFSRVRHDCMLFLQRAERD